MSTSPIVRTGYLSTIGHQRVRYVPFSKELYMPIVRSSAGHSVFVTVAVAFDSVRPEDFFQDNDEMLGQRLAEARRRVLEAIRFADVPLTGRGTCHEVRGIGAQPADLAQFVDFFDSRRARLLKDQRHREANGSLRPYEWRKRSPQVVQKRRSALFSGTDMPIDYFRVIHDCVVGRQEQSQFVDLMRRHLLEMAIITMLGQHEISLLNDIWYVSVSVMDAHPNAREQRRRKSAKSSRRIKNDDRSFHGRPNRDRLRTAA